MEIRAISEGEMPSVWQLWVRALHDHPEAFGASYAWAKDVSPEQSQNLLRHIHDDDGFILGAYEAGVPIGMLSFTRQKGEKFHHKGDIGAVYIAPEHRGKGVAKALVIEALALVRLKMNMIVVCLSVNNDNAPAIAVYKDCGFVGYGVEPKALRVHGRDYDLLHMTYMLHKDL